METYGRLAGKHRAALGGFLGADGHDAIEAPSGLGHFEDALRGLARDIDSVLGEGADDVGIEDAGLEARAFGGDSVPAEKPAIGFGDLASGGIVHA